MNNEVEEYVGELRDLRAIAKKYWQDQSLIDQLHDTRLAEGLGSGPSQADDTGSNPVVGST